MEAKSLTLLVMFLAITRCSLRRNIKEKMTAALNSDVRNHGSEREGHSLEVMNLELESENPSLNCSLPEEERKTFLWRIGTSPPSYFFGTIHVPYTRVWKYLSKNTLEAFTKSGKVYFELDLTNPYTISALTSCQLLPKGLNLSQVLPPGVYSRLESHLSWVRGQMKNWVTEDQEGRGLYSDYLFNTITGNWERKRPIWAMLMVNGLTPSEIASRGFPVLDLYLAQLADQLKKLKGAVERVEEQCVPLNGLTYGQVIFSLNKTLQHHEDIRSGRSMPQYTTDDLINSYRCGNMDSVFNSAQVPVLSSSTQLSREEENISEEINKYFKEHLLYRRNRRMGSRVVELLLNNPGDSFFFVFGAGHFVGNHSVLDVVRNAGFTVEEVKAEDDLSKWRSHGIKEDVPKPRNGVVVGTFEDLSQEEKTRAFLQLLEYKLKVEKESEDNDKKDDRFHELWQKLPTPQVNTNSDTEDVKAVRESIKVWYGLSGSSSTFPSLHLLTFFLLLLPLTR
ncbi:metalloprotease TIKI1 [Eurytemora carolleeae]|uniref:metalloprotease TIKI1 n=1 Tax=Eurytemora carolleeae TaxID=1294199 RepID=UPI000C7786A3|nr:metalloprotease TIKI1 [Eurytemora carolleeae]|eukprot:XP_023322770.1 metalloprotease TIKI1-like [Eurytemora affinis]